MVVLKVANVSKRLGDFTINSINLEVDRGQYFIILGPSGTGGQFDFIFGAFRSRGGKGLICMSSVFTDNEGNLVSRIKPQLSEGAVVTVPRTVTEYVITEYGKAVLKGKSTWERAEALINIAHPQIQDDLVREAARMGLWVRSSKQVS
jgi:acyl-CoA hydrolase